MHEASLVLGILRIVEQEAARHGVRQVTRVRLRVGLLAAVEVRTLCACFEVCAEDTVARGADLDVEIAPLHGTCLACGAELVLAERRFACPQCGAEELDIRGGHEMVITAVEARPADPSPASSPQPRSPDGHAAGDDPTLKGEKQ